MEVSLRAVTEAQTPVDQHSLPPPASQSLLHPSLPSPSLSIQPSPQLPVKDVTVKSRGPGRKKTAAQEAEAASKDVIEHPCQRKKTAFGLQQEAEKAEKEGRAARALQKKAERMTSMGKDKASKKSNARGKK